MVAGVRQVGQNLVRQIGAGWVQAGAGPQLARPVRTQWVAVQREQAGERQLRQQAGGEQPDDALAKDGHLFGRSPAARP